MKYEFNLSEKAHFTSYDDKDRNVYFEEDVKKFIKLIKDMLDDDVDQRELYLSKQIDKLAGEKLK